MYLHQYYIFNDGTYEYLLKNLGNDEYKIIYYRAWGSNRWLRSNAIEANNGKYLDTACKPYITFTALLKANIRRSPLKRIDTKNLLIDLL